MSEAAALFQYLTAKIDIGEAALFLKQNRFNSVILTLTRRIPSVSKISYKNSEISRLGTPFCAINRTLHW